MYAFRILLLTCPNLHISGVDELKKSLFFKYSVSSESDEVAQLKFEWLPRLDTWEHVCFVKKPEPKVELNQLKVFINGEPMGQGQLNMPKYSVWFCL